MSTVTVPTDLTGTYAIDPTRSRVGFVARLAMIAKVRGSFDEFAGSGSFDADDPANSKLAVTIGAASIDTRNGRRDAHLRSRAFLESAIVKNLPDGVDVSIGVVAVPPETRDFDPLIDQADREMYRRKRALAS